MDKDNINLRDILQYAVTAVSYGEPKKGYPNLILGNLWATQPVALLIWPPLYGNKICLTLIK